MPLLRETVDLEGRLILALIRTKKAYGSVQRGRDQDALVQIRWWQANLGVFDPSGAGGWVL